MSSVEDGCGSLEPAGLSLGTFSPGGSGVELDHEWLSGSQVNGHHLGSGGLLCPLRVGHTSNKYLGPGVGR